MATTQDKYVFGFFSVLSYLQKIFKKKIQKKPPKNLGLFLFLGSAGGKGGGVFICLDFLRNFRFLKSGVFFQAGNVAFRGCLGFIGKSLGPMGRGLLYFGCLKVNGYCKVKNPSPQGFLIFFSYWRWNFPVHKTFRNL